MHFPHHVVISYVVIIIIISVFSFVCSAGKRMPDLHPRRGERESHLPDTAGRSGWSESQQFRHARNAHAREGDFIKISHRPSHTIYYIIICLVLLPIDWQAQCLPVANRMRRMISKRLPDIREDEVLSVVKVADTTTVLPEPRRSSAAIKTHSQLWTIAAAACWSLLLANHRRHR